MAGGGDDGRPGGRLRALAVLGLLVLLGACRVDADVVLRTDEGGGGEVAVTVGLDREAAAQVADLGRQLRVEDLVGAGWRVEGPRAAGGGRVELRASKRFDSPDGAERALRELGGADGPFASLRLAYDRSPVRTRSELGGGVDLSGGLAAFSDPVLTERLAGLPLGVDPAVLEQQLGRPLADAVAVRLTARLPGRTGTWAVRLGERAAVALVAERWDVRRLALGTLSLAATVALAVVVLTRRRRG